MKKRIIFSFLLVLLLTGCTDKTIKADEVSENDKQYYVETYEYRSDEAVDPADKKKINGKTYSLVNFEDEEIRVEKGYDIKTKELEEKNVVKEKQKFPETKMIDGEEYVLKKTEYIQGDVRKETLNKTVYYTDQLPDETFADEYYDELSGETIPVVFKMEDSDVSTEWIDDLQVPITVYDYYAFNYQIGSGMVTATPDSINISSAIPDILAHENMSSSDYRLDRAAWNGEVYEENNIYMRNAIAYGSRLQYNYTAYYKADVELPILDNAILTYERKMENPSKDITVFKRTVIYSHFPMETVVLISIALVLMIAFILLILFKLGRKKEEGGK